MISTTFSSQNLPPAQEHLCKLYCFELGFHGEQMYCKIDIVRQKRRMFETNVFEMVVRVPRVHYHRVGYVAIILRLMFSLVYTKIFHLFMLIYLRFGECFCCPHSFKVFQI